MTPLYERMAAAMATPHAPERDGSVNDAIGEPVADQQQGNGSDPGSKPSAVQSCPVAPTQPKGTTMPKGKKKDAPVNGQVMKPDFDQASRIYEGDIAPANRKQKQAMKDASDGWKAIKDDAHVHKGGFRTAMKVAEMEEADQQAWLRSFYGGLEKRRVGLYRDLADMAESPDDDATGFVPPPTVSAPQVDLSHLN